MDVARSLGLEFCRESQNYFQQAELSQNAFDYPSFCLQIAFQAKVFSLAEGMYIEHV